MVQRHPRHHARGRAAVYKRHTRWSLFSTAAEVEVGFRCTVRSARRVPDGLDAGVFAHFGPRQVFGDSRPALRQHDRQGHRFELAGCDVEGVEPIDPVAPAGADEGCRVAEVFDFSPVDVGFEIHGPAALVVGAAVGPQKRCRALGHDSVACGSRHDPLSVKNRQVPA